MAVPDIVVRFRAMSRTMTHQIPWDKLHDLRAGGLYMTVPASPHFSYLQKFQQPIQIPLVVPLGEEEIWKEKIIGIACLSVPMEDHGRTFRIETYWPMRTCIVSHTGEDWIMSLGREIKE